MTWRDHQFFDNPWRIHGAGILMLTWLGYIDGIHVTIYSSTMDPMGNDMAAQWYMNHHESAIISPDMAAQTRLFFRFCDAAGSGFVWRPRLQCRSEFNGRTSLMVALNLTDCWCRGCKKREHFNRSTLRNRSNYFASAGKHHIFFITTQQ